MSTSKPICLYTITLVISLLAFANPLLAQDKVPVREYTNPDEVVTFDRTTPFARAIDVINEFSQEAQGKIILNRTGFSGTIGISIPPMHWEDALDLILRVNGLSLLEQPEYFEIISAPAETTQAGKPTSAATGQAGEGDGPVATTSSREVRINAIFFEGSRRALQEIGVDWSTLSGTVPTEVGDFVNDPASEQIPATEFADQFVQVNAKGASSVSQNVFNSLINFGEIANSGIRVQALFSAFEADNLGEILASPTVKVMDGEEGRIQVGQDFSIKQRDFAGNVIDQFFSVGTILTVTPQIIEQRDTTFIHLSVQAERSSAQPDPVSTIINKQEATTQSLLIDGEATVIAGLYRTEESEVRRGIPVLKDLPPWFFGLRYLFGFNSKDYQMRELVILIQASIEPTIPERYANRKTMKTRFEVLEEERMRIRNEIYERGTAEGKLLEDSEINKIEADRKVEEVEEEPEVEQEKEPVKKDSVQTDRYMEQKKTQEEKRTVQEKDAEVKTDPEVKNEPIPLNFDEEKQDTTAKAEAKVEEKDTKEKAAQEDTTQEVTADQEQDGVTYYIIAGSFGVRQNAENLRDQLAKQGYQPVLIDKEGSSDITFVAYRSFKDREMAMSELKYIKSNQNEAAWLFTSN